MNSTAGPSTSRLTGSEKKEKKQKHASELKSSKSGQQKSKASDVGPEGPPKSTGDKKVIFRPVLDNPLRVEWPNIPLNVENSILALVVQLLETVRPYHEQRSETSKRNKSSRRVPYRKVDITAGAMPTKDSKGKGKASQHSEEGGMIPENSALSERKRKRDALSSDDEDKSSEGSDHPSKRRKSDDTSEDSNEPSAITPPTRPEMLDHVVLGLNAVTKRLEGQSFGLRAPPNQRSIQHGPTEAVHAETSKTNSGANIPLGPHKPLRLVLVCRTDVDSATMIAHLPTLTAACNSARSSSTQTQSTVPDILLVGLPYGAESTLAEGSGLRRAAVMAFDIDTPGLEDRIAPFLPSIPILRASWLSVAQHTSLPTPSSGPSIPSTQFVATHIKHLKTTAPRDIKAAKQKRAEDIKQARSKRQANRTKLGVAGPRAVNKEDGDGDGKGKAQSATQVESARAAGGETSAVDSGVQVGHIKSKRRQEKQPSILSRPRKTLEKVVIRAKAPGSVQAE